VCIAVFGRQLSEPMKSAYVNLAQRWMIAR